MRAHISVVDGSMFFYILLYACQPQSPDKDELKSLTVGLTAYVGRWQLSLPGMRVILKKRAWM